MRKKIIALSVAALAALVVMGFFALDRSGTGSPSADGSSADPDARSTPSWLDRLFGNTGKDRSAATGAAGSGATRPVGENSRSSKQTPGSIALPDEDEARQNRSGIDFRKTLADYKKQTRYPPNSRPLFADQEHLLQPDRAAARRQPTSRSSERRAEPEPEPDYTFVLQADRYAVVGKQPLITTLTVFKGATGETRVPVRISSARVVPVGQGPRSGQTAAELAFNDGGTEGDRVAGDHVYTNRLVPATSSFSRTGGDYRLEVVFDDPAGKTARGTVLFLYTSEQSVPAHFTGRFTERLEEGSLVVGTEVEVRREGTFAISANLFAKDGTPLAHARFEGPLSAGKSEVDLLFFGKILVDGGKAGAFLLTDLRGYRTVQGGSPNREMMSAYPRQYETRAYSLDQFSDREWESPEKEARIKMYDNLTQ